MQAHVCTDWSYRGLDTVVLENRMLRVVILPQAGGKIWQITYKPLDADLLWNNPRISSRQVAVRVALRRCLERRLGRTLPL